MAVAVVRPPTTAPIRPLAWEPPYAMGVPLKREREKNIYIHTLEPYIFTLERIKDLNKWEVIPCLQIRSLYTVKMKTLTKHRSIESAQYLSNS